MPPLGLGCGGCLFEGGVVYPGACLRGPEFPPVEVAVDEGDAVGALAGVGVVWDLRESDHVFLPF